MNSAICHMNRHSNEIVKKYYNGCVWKMFWKVIYLDIYKNKIKKQRHDMICV